MVPRWGQDGQSYTHTVAARDHEGFVKPLQRVGHNPGVERFPGPKKAGGGERDLRAVLGASADACDQFRVDSPDDNGRADAGRELG
jgi:hypothetical protein